MVLLLGSGAMIRTFVSLHAIRPGFEPEGALTFPVDLYDWEKYDGREAVIAVFRELEERVRALPGVEDVGSTSTVPFTSGGGSQRYAWDEASEARWNTWGIVRVVTGDYFRTMGTRLLAGRSFSGPELTEPTASVIIDETLAREAWPNQDPLGKTLIYGRRREQLEVVGVVEHANLRWLREDERGTIYRPFATTTRGAMKVVVRGSGDLGSLIAPIKQEIRALDPGLAIQTVTTLKDLVGNVLAPTRFALMLMSIFAVLALLLAAVGLYGVISYGVGQRTAEIGIRMAFGADRRRIFRLVVGRGAGLIALGTVIGAASTLALSRFLASVVYGVSTTDPVTLVAVALVLLAVGLLASYDPARRAMRVDPVSALRAG
jgi:predicted permease